MVDGPISGTPSPISASLRHYLAQRWESPAAPILVVGDAMLDVYVFGAVERISPEAPVPVIRQLETRSGLGGAANVAANIASLGGACHLVSVAGTDQEARQMGELLERARVTFDLVREERRSTTVKTRFTAGQHQLLRMDREDATPVGKATEAAIVAGIAERLSRCRLLVLSDYNKGMLTDRVLSDAIRLAQDRDVPVLVDPKRRDFTVYRGATVIKPNRGELGAATGMAVGSDAEIERAARAAAAATGASLLVTRSEAGMSLLRPDGTSVHMPTHAREVYDVTGAGDTVMAALAVGLAGGRPIEEAMAFANIAGGIAVAKQGAAVVSAAELEAERALIAEDYPAAGGGVVDEEEAVRLRQLWKTQGLMVGFTNGCFDLLHPGHIALLRGAAKACDRLIVGLNSDASVRRLKGPERPVQNADARAAVLGAVEHVNLVVVFDEDTPRRLIERLQPDILVKGADYKVEDIVGADIVVRAGGKVMTVDLVPEQSTTRLIDRSRSDRTGAAKAAQ
ncbi:MAG TPA: D-glycero-beta-D-manno-heptose-7-phosphate kinase [Reyranella sp.]|nr:D-glycero-beta-D-manno-heptose-7-phosphate kinase [Reyranella sp.]